MKPITITITTYNRPEELLDLLKSIALLSDTDQLLEEIIVLNNGSTIPYTEAEKMILSMQNAVRIKYLKAEKNSGVSGRNRTINLARTKYLLMLDDDTLLTQTDVLKNVVAVFEENSNSDSRPVGIATLRVLYHSTLAVQKIIFPHKLFDKYKDKPRFETYYFVGTATAVRREIFDKTNLITEDFFYGMEEYDLGYRVIDLGYSLIYDGRITVLHKESPNGRKATNEVLRMKWVNKSKVAFRYLPKRYFYSTAVLWSLFYLKNTGCDLKGFFTGWKQIFNINTKTENRTAISAESIRYIKSLEGRLSY